MKYLNRILQIVIISSLCFFSMDKAGATHVAGGYIQFQYTGTGNQYIVTLTLYRDCSGIGLGGYGQTVDMDNNCPGVADFSINLTNPTVTEVSQLCASQLVNSTCNGGTQPGYEEFVYTATVNIPPCDTWTSSYSLCCRNTTNNLQGQPEFETSTQINTNTNGTNTTPTVTAQPEPYICNNQPYTYNLGASEPDGHTIQYSLVPAQSYGGNAPYAGGFSGANPIPGVNIDPNTGTVTFTPTNTGPYVFVIQMTEFDAAGNVVSVTNYDYQTYVVNCSNNAPQPPAGGVSNTSGSIVQNGPDDLTLCQGFQGCFDVVFSDPDPGDVLTVQSNLSSVLPGATITETGTNPLTISVCWTPTTTSGVVTLSFLVEDDACPLLGQNNYAASINVVNPGSVNTSTTAESCGGLNDGTATLNVVGGVSPFTYNITGPVNNSNGTGSFNNLPPGTYNYTVNTGGGCDLTGTFDIDPGPTLTANSSATDVTCNGDADGDATGTPTSGNAPYFYVWSQGGTAIGQTSQTASNLGPGTYDVEITDSDGCETVVSATVNEPAALGGNLAATDATCNGNCDGQIDVNGTSGGNTPYQYSINGGANQGGTNFSGLCQGAQQVVITDDNGCTLTLNETVGEPAPLNITLDNVVDATCGNNNGEITVTGSGGMPAYQYSAGGPNQANNTITGLAPGTYTVTVTDANGCTADLSATTNAVGQPTAFVDNQTNLSCFGGNDGSVLIGTNGASAPITYSLNGGPGQTSNSFTNLSAGSYTVDITDGNGCTASTSFTITEPPILNYNTAITDAQCNGDCDGQIVVNASGGTAPYQYSNDNGITFNANNTITGLCAGNVNLVVQDANGCLSNSTEVIGAPATVGASFTLTDPACVDACDGSIDVTANGGTAPYQYSVNGGAFQGGSLLSGLCAGNHNIVVEDGNGCQFNATETLSDPAPINISQVSMTPSNCGFNDGELEVSATGPNPAYEYSINGGANQASGLFQNMLAGSYKVIATGATGCQDSAFFGINDIQMDGQLVSKTDVSCHGGSDAMVEVTNLAGSPPIVYELDNSGTTQGSGIFNGLSAGSHSVTIYDNGLCIYTVPFTINEPDEIDFSTNITDVACDGGSSGIIEFTGVTGGVGNYQYSIDGGFVFQAGQTFNGQTQGNYNLVVVDDNGCPVTGTATVDEAPPININTSITDLTCNGDNSGVIQISASGGTGSYTYSNDNGATFQPGLTFISLAAGNYDLVVEDAAGCQEDLAVTVNEPAPLSATYTTTDALCKDSCNGEIEIVANGGTTPYQYSNDNGTTLTTNNIIDGICASTFTAYVEDDHGCSITSSETVNEPAAITFTSAETPSTCSDANGEIAINAASGGTPGYDYSIDNGATFSTGNNFNGLTAGTFNIVVEDQNDCLATGTQIVTNEASPVIDFVTTTDPLCNGDANGEVEVTASGGTGALSYSVDGGPQQPGVILTGLAAGSHTVEVEDANGCIDTETFTLNEPAVLDFNTNITDLTCYQNSTGSINVVPSGGTPSYQYSFDNGTTFGSSPNNNFIAAGNYDIVVEDDHGCQATETVTVNEPDELVFDNIGVTDATCYTYCDGEIDLDIAGGTTPYSYDWDNNVAGLGDDVATGLCADNYGFVITDDNGCIIADDADVNEPGPVQITAVNESNVTCNGDCDGSIEIVAPAGVQYSNDNGGTFQPGNTFNGLCPGNFDIVVEDAAGCLADTTAEITQPAPLTLDLRDDTTKCFGESDSLFGSGTGGIQPYTYDWSDGTTAGQVFFTTSNTQTFTLQITDINGCISTLESSTITVIPQLDISVMSDTTICPGGTAMLQVQGIDGRPTFDNTTYDYSWSSGQTSQVINVSPSTATTYTATVEDQCGDVATADLDVDLHDLPDVDFTGDPLEGCSPLEVELTNTTPAGQVGGNCTWNIQGTNYQNCGSTTHTFTEPGCYDVTLTVESPETCFNDTTKADYICVHPNPVADFTYNPKKPTINDTEVHFKNTSTGDSIRQWRFPYKEGSTKDNPVRSFTEASAGQELNVCLEVTSNLGCTHEVCEIVKIHDDFVVHVPNTFTPDNDEYNQTFLPVFNPTADIHNYELLIFSRWGELLFESHNSNVGWDGTFRGKLVQDGVYVWQISLEEGTEDTDRSFRGHVTLIK